MRGNQAVGLVVILLVVVLFLFRGPTETTSDREGPSSSVESCPSCPQCPPPAPATQQREQLPCPSCPRCPAVAAAVSTGGSFGEARDAFLRSFEQQQAAFCRQQAFLGTHPQSHRVPKIRPHPGVEPFPIYVYRSGDFVSATVNSSGSWEGDKWELMYKKLEEKAQEWSLPRSEVGFMDFGANIGWFTHMASAAGFPTFSFEAMPLNEILLRSTLCANPDSAKRVHLFGTAMGDKAGMCVIKSQDTNLGNGILDCSPGAVQGGEHQAVARAKVTLNTLDRIFYETPGASIKYLPRVALAKIDIEGFEPYLLRGGQRFFREMQIPYITTEVNQFFFQMRGDTIEPYLMQWDQLGYDIRKGSWDTPIVPKSLYSDPKAFEMQEEIYLTLRPGGI